MSLSSRSLKPYPPVQIVLTDTSSIGSSSDVPTFADNFNDNSLDTGNWTRSDTTVTETSQQLNIVNTSSSYLITNSAYNLTDKAIRCQFITVPTGSSGYDMQLLLSTSAGGSFTQFTMIDVNGTNLRTFFNSSLINSTTFNAAVHKWFRMRFDVSGTNTLYFEYSTDGTTWSALASVSLAGAGSTYTSVYAYLRLFNSAGSSATAAYDDFFIGTLGTSTPTGQVAVSWKNRNRLTGLVKKQTDATETVETGQTTTIRVYKGDGTTLLRTVTGQTGTTYNYTAAFEVADGGSPLQTALVFKLKSARDGLESLDVVKTLTR